MVTIAIPPAPPSDEDDPLTVKRVIRERVKEGHTVLVEKKNRPQIQILRAASNIQKKIFGRLVVR